MPHGWIGRSVAAALVLASASLQAAPYDLLEPLGFERTRGKPQTVTNVFPALDTGSTYELRLTNGEPSGDPATSAVVRLNGETIFSPRDFKRRIEALDADVHLLRENTLTVELRGKPGSAVTLGIIGWDDTPPTIEASVVPAPNPAGWHRRPVRITYACDDDASGVAHCPEPVEVTEEAAGRVVTATARDAAGNEASASVTIDLDRTVPTVTPVPEPPPNPAGWHNEVVSVAFDCADALSGVAQCSEAVRIETESTGQRVEGEVEDVAGNSAANAIDLDVDLTAPTIEARLARTPNAAGWYRAPVTVEFTCSDALSGLAQCPEPVTVAQDGEDQVVQAQARDLADNTASVTEAVSLDTSAPELAITASPGANEAGWHATPVTLTHACSDALSGVVDCPAERTLTSEGPGQRFEAQVQDAAGNTTTATRTLSIDTTAPTVSFLEPAADSEYSTRRPSVRLQLADNLALEPATLALTVNGAAFPGDCTVESGEAVCTPTADLPRGGVTLTASVADAAGHSAEASRSFRIEDDADGDGVPDGEDQCPGTGADHTSNADGCSPHQLDGDNDGISDAVDQCTTTPPGSEPGADGCGEAERDTDGDGTPDISDAYPEDAERTELPLLTIDSPETLITVGRSPIDVSGQVDPDARSLAVNGAEVAVAEGQWQAAVHLQEGHNTVQARMIGPDGMVSTASISVSLDLTPPELTVESHTEGQTVHRQPVAITGLVNDLVRGTVEASEAVVQVNATPAEIVNRSYIARGVALEPGANLITIRGSDQAGNLAEETLTLHYAEPAGRRLELVGGQDQSAVITATLDAPLAVRVLDDAGEAVADKPVVFRVIQGAGLVGAATDRADRGFIATTDDKGIARTRFQLGRRVGTGNHKVRARVVGYADEIVFHASGEGSAADKLSVNSGNNQRGGTHQRLPAPFVVVATDLGNNVVEDARVAFEVTRGGGTFRNGEDRIVQVTDGDGRASAHLMLGAKTGLDAQRVTATLLDGPGDSTITAGFTASAFVPGDPGQTAISGVVVDNQDTPIPGVTVRVEGTSRQAVSDEQGQFTITEAPVGPVHLIADGSTAAVPGEYPSLAYNLTTVSGVDNPLSAPIYMVKLNEDTKVWAGEQDVAVTLPEVPGFRLEIPAGSVTFPDGSREGYVSVTAVNANHVPMAPPNGMQPQFIVTIQPAGARFDPPARLSLPNVDAHAPGAQVEMYSFDHDLEEFVAIGLGTVSEDATTITTNPGVGVVKAGWHCGSQPSASGCCTNKECGECRDGCDCENFLAEKPLSNQQPGNCKTENCGKDSVNDGDEPEDDCQFCDNGEVKHKDDNDGCDDGQYCTSADGQSPGPDKCEGGECQGRLIESELKDQHTFRPDEFIDMVRGVKNTLESSGKCDVGGIKLEGALTEEVTDSCCESEDRFTTASKYSGSMSLGLGEVECRIPAVTLLGLASLTGNVGIGLEGTISGSGTRSDCEGDCDLSVHGDMGATVSGAVGAEIIDDDVISTQLGLRGGGSLTGEHSCKGFTGGGCVGPPVVFGTITLANALDKEVSYALDGFQVCF